MRCDLGVGAGLNGVVLSQSLNPKIMKKLRIAFIGQKGLPARYGGVETHVEQIATRLAARGHEVTAYCRDWFKEFAENSGVEFEQAGEGGGQTQEDGRGDDRSPPGRRQLSRMDGVHGL